MRTLKRAVLALTSAVLASATVAYALPVKVQHEPTARQNLRVTFHARQLPDGGYYYAVIVLEPYKHYTRNTPPPCSASSDMLRTEYGYPYRSVALALIPGKSRTHHWCRQGTYEGAVYAVPHPPPCEARYPCRSEPYEEPCAGVAPGCVLGVVARPQEWAYPDGLPAPRASGTTIVARFTVKFR